VRIELRDEATEIFAKRALRYLFVFDDIVSQDKEFRYIQWLEESGFDSSEYTGKWFKTPADFGHGYIKLLANEGARFSSRQPADCQENDIVEIESPPETYSGSLLEMLRTVFDRDKPLRTRFPHAHEVIQPHFLVRHHGLPNDYDVLIALDSIFQVDNAISDGEFFIGTTEKIIELSREREYLQLSINAQTLAGLISIKKIWMAMVEILAASRQKKISVSEEMLWPIFTMFIKVIKTSLSKPRVTTSKTAALLMMSILMMGRLGVGTDNEVSPQKNQVIGELIAIGSVIIFSAADGILAEAEEKLRAARSEQELEQFYDKLFLTYPYFFAARLCFDSLAEYGDEEAKDVAKVKGNAAEEKAVRISNSLMNSIYDLYGDMLARLKEQILLSDSEFDRNAQIFDVFDNRYLYPDSYKKIITKGT